MIDPTKALTEYLINIGLDYAYPDAARLLALAEADILTGKTFPKVHWRRIHSINPVEPLHREVKRRTNVVGVFPDRLSVIRLVGSLLKQKDGDWRAVSRRYFSEKKYAVGDRS